MIVTRDLKGMIILLLLDNHKATEELTTAAGLWTDQCFKEIIIRITRAVSRTKKCSTQVDIFGEQNSLLRRARER